MPDRYADQTWVNLPTQTTPLNATRLSHMEAGIKLAAGRPGVAGVDYADWAIAPSVEVLPAGGSNSWFVADPTFNAVGEGTGWVSEDSTELVLLVSGLFRVHHQLVASAAATQAGKFFTAEANITNPSLSTYLPQWYVQLGAFDGIGVGLNHFHSDTWWLEQGARIGLPRALGGTDRSNISDDVTLASATISLERIL